MEEGRSVLGLANSSHRCNIFIFQNTHKRINPGLPKYIAKYIVVISHCEYSDVPSLDSYPTALNYRSQTQ